MAFKPIQNTVISKKTRLPTFIASCNETSCSMVDILRFGKKVLPVSTGYVI